jgi:hypothetical protein
MPDDLHLLLPLRNPGDFDLGAIKTDLEFLMERLSKLPTRRELVRFGVWVALGLCVLALIGLRMWTRWVWACSLL